MSNKIKGSFILNENGVLEIKFQDNNKESKKEGKYTYNLKFDDEIVKIGSTEQSPNNSATFIAKRGYTKPSTTTAELHDEINNHLNSGASVSIEYTEHTNTTDSTKSIKKKLQDEYKEQYGEYPKYDKQRAGKKWKKDT